MNFIYKFFSRKEGKPGYVEPVILHDGPQTKRIAQLWHIQHNHPENDGLSLDLIKFDKASGVEWPEESVPTKEIGLSEDEVSKLYNYLSSNYGALGIRESGEYAIIPIDGDLPWEQQAITIKLIKNLLRLGGVVSLDQLAVELEKEPALFTRLRDFTQFRKFDEARKELERLISESNIEQDFKDWFKRNSWIFGTEYISREEISQIALRHRIDLCFTSADGYQDVIELKTPDKALLEENQGHPGSFYPSEDLSKAIAQCGNYLYEAEEQRANIERNYKLPFLKPRARIIIGRSYNWDEGKRQALRKLNATFHNIDIMTYDHILLRANKMIAYFKDAERR